MKTAIFVTTILLIIIILSFYVFVFISYRNENKEKRYCGTIIEKGYEAPTSGYKIRQEATYFVVLMVDSIQTAIRINCTFPVHHSSEIGSKACYDLSEFDLSVYGNGDQHLIK